MEGIPEEEEIGKMKQLADTYGNKLSQESYDNMQDIFGLYMIKCRAGTAQKRTIQK